MFIRLYLIKKSFTRNYGELCEEMMNRREADATWTQPDIQVKQARTVMAELYAKKCSGSTNNRHK